jgi:hypothetical protein
MECEGIRDRYNSRRDPKYLTFYNISKDWKRQSRAKLESVQYKCEAKLSGCQLYAVEVQK